MMANAAYRIPFDSGLLLFSPTHFSFEFIVSNLGIKGGRFLDYYFVYGVLGIFLGYLVSKNYKLKYVIIFSVSLYVAIVILTLILTGLFGSFKTWISDYSQFVEKKTNSYIDLYLTQMDSSKNIFQSRGIDLEKKLEIAAEIYKESVVFGIAPKGGYLIRQIIVIFLSILFVKRYFKRKLNKAALSFHIKNYRIANDWVWGLIASWGLIYINLYIRNNFLGIMSWNTAVIISFLFFLKGLSIIKIAADRIRIPVFLQYIVLLFLLFYFFIFFVTIVTGIGVADIWLKISEYIGNHKKRRNA